MQIYINKEMTEDNKEKAYMEWTAINSALKMDNNTYKRSYNMNVR